MRKFLILIAIILLTPGCSTAHVSSTTSNESIIFSSEESTNQIDYRQKILTNESIYMYSFKRETYTIAECEYKTENDNIIPSISDPWDYKLYETSNSNEYLGGRISISLKEINYSNKKYLYNEETELYVFEFEYATSEYMNSQKVSIIDNQLVVSSITIQENWPNKSGANVSLKRYFYQLSETYPLYNKDYSISNFSYDELETQSRYESFNKEVLNNLPSLEQFNAIETKENGCIEMKKASDDALTFKYSFDYSAYIEDSENPHLAIVQERTVNIEENLFYVVVFESLNSFTNSITYAHLNII